MQQSILPMCKCGKDKAYQDGLCIGCYSIATLQSVLSKQIVPHDGRRNRRKTHCVICGAKGTHAKDRCTACYEYRRRHGVERPHYLANPPQACINCGKRRKLKGAGRCKPCYEYFWLYGKERRPALFNRTIRPGDPCVVCEERQVYAAGRCKRCYYYKYRHGAERPRELTRQAPHAT